MVEELVADNETLKRDNSELQVMLGNLHEEVRLLKEEAEERASRPRLVCSYSLILCALL
jgi:hypothetical protein